MITYGTNPGMGMSIDQPVPDPATLGDRSERDSAAKALEYMGLDARQAAAGTPVDVVFFGCCTNSRISDLRDAAEVLRGRHVAPSVRVLVVPGSQQVKRQAEAEGLDAIFRDAGAEWREAGCSMCIAMNGDQLAARASSPCRRATATSRAGRGGAAARSSPARSPPPPPPSRA